MRYSGLQVTFQEIPNEICLSIHISGCPLACPGCHSADLWNADQGVVLNPTEFESLLSRYQDYISCVVFMGGEWFPEKLFNLLKKVHNTGLSTALYTGLELDQVSKKLISELDYIKVGPYISKLGGLDSSKTNQRLIDLKNNLVINKIKSKTKSEENDETYR